jgi:hypothetical protein
MLRRLSPLWSVLATAVLLWSGPARAAGLQPDYSINAAACPLAAAQQFITQPNAPLPKHVVNYGKVEFATGTTGILTFVCPVIGPDLADVTLRNLEALVQDSSGARNGTGWVEARVYKINARDANFLDTYNPIAYVQPDYQDCLNKRSTPTQYVRCYESRFSQTHVFDFNQYYYFLEIKMARSDPAVQVGVAGVRFNVYIVR